MTGPDMVIALKESPDGTTYAVLAIYDETTCGWVNLAKRLTEDQAKAIRDHWAARRHEKMPDLIVKVSIPELGIA